MKEHWLKFEDWFQKREAREQKGLKIAAFFIAIFLVYFLIWSPINQHTDTLREQILADAKTLLTMQNIDAKIQKIAKNGSQQVVTPVEILTRLQQQLNEANLSQSVAPLKQTNNGMIELHFQNVDFDQLMGFLITATKAEPIIIKQFSVSASENIGQVNADVQVNSASLR